MKLTFAQDRILAVMAHPDDAELLCAGTLARAKADGAAIAVCVMCRGDKGAGSATAGQDLGRIRNEEASAAAEVVGAKLFWFGAGDGELFDSYENRRKLIEIYRQYRPTLVIAHATEDYHADHRAASQIAEAASWFCGSRGHVTESPALQSPPKVWFADTVDMSGFEPQFFIDVSAHMEVKRRMLACHKSQLERGKDGDFAPLTALMQRQCETRGAQADVAAAEAFRWHHAFKRMGAF
jgi:LmbE family N-acetylglucosaminyl deacetylase